MLNYEIQSYIDRLPQGQKPTHAFVQRNGKQCRERWLTALDPHIKKSQWTVEEDLEFLDLWLQLGNKWCEIAQKIEGRTESQVKNRFKLILRREMIQQNKYDPEALKLTVIPNIIKMLRTKNNKDLSETISSKSGQSDSQEEGETEQEEDMVDPDGDSVMK